MRCVLVDAWMPHRDHVEPRHLHGSLEYSQTFIVLTKQASRNERYKVEQRIKHYEQVEINFPDIVHDDIRTIILRLAQYRTGS